MKRKEKYFGMSKRIARWKLDNPFENFLARKADHSEFWKRAYVNYYRIFDSKYYKGGMKFVEAEMDTHASEWEGLSPKAVKRDMIYCLHRFGIAFLDYWIYGFVDQSLKARNEFVSDKLRYYYCDILNTEEVCRIMTDKYECYKAFKPFFKRDVLGVHSKDDLQAFTDFLKKHNTFIYKPIYEHSGHGIKKVTLSEKDAAEFIDTELAHGPFVVEELIEQGDELAAIHNNSINSLRVTAFRIGDDVEIVGVTMRMGSGKSITDNAGSGGMYVSVNPKNGIVQSDAVNYVGKHFMHHPDSGVLLMGYQLPKWDEAVQLIHDMATTLPGATMIAWDIAYGKNGWQMIEANESGAWTIMQSNLRKGMKKQLFELMDRYFEYQKQNRQEH